jgi:hypothetical protein
MAFLMKKSGSHKLLVWYMLKSENPDEWLQSNTCQLGFHHNALTVSQSVMPQNKTHLISNAADNNVPLHDM